MAAVGAPQDRATQYKVYINELAAGTTEDELASHFQDCGAIIRATVLRADPT